MEIASKRTEEERSSQDKVDEEVSEDFCSCYEMKISLSSSEQWKLFYLAKCTVDKQNTVILICPELVEIWRIEGYSV